MRLMIGGAIVFLSLTAIAHAAQTQSIAINDLIKTASGDQHLQDLVLGFGKGLEAANLKLKAIGRSMLYCQPDGLAITGDQYVHIVDGYVQKHPTWGKVDGRILPEVLTQAMMDAFPCK
ncbi:hypothetical protein G6L73_05850 [Agrobacterium rhizogenes]|nr:hypothetical protein [Rhizobium rhizogenes]